MAAFAAGCASTAPAPLPAPVAPEPMVSATPSRASVWTDDEGLPTLAPLMQRVTPAVVNISAASRVPVEQHPLLNDPMFQRFLELFELPVPETTPRQRMGRRDSVGSGFIVDARRGYVLTNYHVVENADQIMVTLKDGRSFPAESLTRDPDTDLALLRIEPIDIPALSLGDSDALRVGDFVIAIGNPFGLGQTVTSGIVSALGHERARIEGFKDFIQTDASINPGNSGGPLINLAGEVVGINTAIIGPTGANVGIGFAVPSNMAQAAMDRLVRE
jgi:S1-C subfamily serine protease